jgi:hypothetical protein
MRKKERKRLKRLAKQAEKRKALEERGVSFESKPKMWLFTDWISTTSFRIYTSFEDRTLITTRELRKNGCTCWINLSSLEKQIKDFEKENNLCIFGLRETLFDIKKDGFGFWDDEKERIIKEVEERKSKGVKILLID